MTPNEIAAYNRGIEDVLNLASRSADAMDKITVLRPTRYNFASAALRAMAEEGLALLKRPDGSSGADEPETVPKPSLNGEPPSSRRSSR